MCDAPCENVCVFVVLLCDIKLCIDTTNVDLIVLAKEFMFLLMFVGRTTQKVMDRFSRIFQEQ